MKIEQKRKTEEWQDFIFTNEIESQRNFLNSQQIAILKSNEERQRRIIEFNSLR